MAANRMFLVLFSEIIKRESFHATITLLVLEIKRFLEFLIIVDILVAMDIGEVGKEKLEDRTKSFENFVFAKSLNSDLTKIET